MARYLVKAVNERGLKNNVLARGGDVVDRLAARRLPRMEVDLAADYVIYRFRSVLLNRQEKNGPFFRHVTFAKAIYNIIHLKSSFDLLHAHTYYWPAAAAIVAGRLLNKPVIVTGHSMLSRLQDEVAGNKFPAYYLSLLAKCDYFVAINKAIQQEAHEIAGIPLKRIHLIYNGIDTGRFK